MHLTEKKYLRRFCLAQRSYEPFRCGCVSRGSKSQHEILVEERVTRASDPEPLRKKSLQNNETPLRTAFFIRFFWGAVNMRVVELGHSVLGGEP